MNTVKKLNLNSFPKLLQDFSEENFNLKALCASLVGLLFLSVMTIIFLVKSGPEVIALDSQGEISMIETKITDLQVQAATKEYLSRRYSWDPATFEDQTRKAQFFVYPALLTAFQKSMNEVKKYVLDKKVTQRVYPKNIKIDLKNKLVSMELDRITEFENLKAATEMRLKLDFVIGDRTPTNPWGVYISKESEGSSQ